MKKNAPTTNELLNDTTAEIAAVCAIVNDTPLLVNAKPVDDEPLTNEQTESKGNNEGDEPDDDDDEGDEGHDEAVSDKTALETPAQPVPTTLTEQLAIIATMMKQMNEMRAEMASHAEQVTGLHQQLAARDLLPRRGRAYAMRPWMKDPAILALPTVSTAPILILNGPKDAVSVSWTKKRNDLMDKWAELKMYDPLMTWGTCSTNEDKLQMVCHVHCVRHFTDMSNVCVCACGVRVCVCNAVRRSKP
jgi:hypothetical protein